MTKTVPSGLIPISAATLSADATLFTDVYLRPSPEAPAVLFFSGNEKPDIEKLRALATGEGCKLFISSLERDRYQRYLRENLRALTTSQSVQERVAIIGTVMRDVLSEEFKTSDTDRIVAASKQLASDCSNILGEEPITATQMCSVLHHDYATFTHVSNVSLYSVLLGRELGFCKQELAEIALGALLHDLGKLQVDERILNKPGRLNEFEFREIQKHPTIGFRELANRTDLNHGQLMMCYQHHERVSGQGYPVGCTGDEIHPWAKLIAIVDVFEAITSYRPYRNPMAPRTALAVLEKGSGTEFDPDLVAVWKRITFSRNGRSTHV
jgi:HD-GYP domain-containing protein (c-di-GMP phosphodiesterase class II)